MGYGSRITTLFLFLGCFTVPPCFATSYRCQIFSLPDFFTSNVTWDGKAPFQSSFTYQGHSATLKIDSIGLAGHPEYLFQIVWEGRALLAVSQKADLKDYNLTWKSDGEETPTPMIQIACR